MMCIYVIYKCLSWCDNQRQDLGKQAKTAKPSYQWEAAKHPVPRGE
jgi:hypothetical protein